MNTPPARPENATEDSVCASENSVFSAGVGVRIQVWLPRDFCEENPGFVTSLNRLVEPALWKLYGEVHDKVYPENIPDEGQGETRWGDWFKSFLR